MIKTTLILTLICLLVPGCSRDDCHQNNSTEKIFINGHLLNTEIALTAKSRSCGLSNRKKLPANNGMLFVYPENITIKFWMKDTFFPLSIAFIDSHGTIQDVQEMEADNEHKYYWFNAQTSYALEVNAGWFSKAGVSVGDKINLQFLKNYSDID